MIAMNNFFEQDANNDIRNPAHSFKGWGSEKTDFISEPGATTDYTGKAEDSADTPNKKLATPGPTQVKHPTGLTQFLSGGKSKVTPTSQL